MSTAPTATKPKQIRLPIVYVTRTREPRTNGSRTAYAHAVIARDHVGEFEVAWNHSRERMMILAHRIKDAIRFGKGKAISDDPPPFVEGSNGQ